MNKKFVKDFIVVENKKLNSFNSLLKLKPLDGIMPEVEPGQFVQIYIEGSKNTFLRRPISINNVENGQLWLLVKEVGDGTHALVSTPVNGIINMVLPLGKGFSLSSSKTLLIGGGVGIAPLLLLGKCLKERNADVTFLLGAKTKDELIELEEFAQYGQVCLSTEDGTSGEKGFVTQHSILNCDFDKIQCCGPLPMMKAVAKIAMARGINCEVSLENMMACGLGACLCCVEDTKSGNVCVCQDGPVFNINDLKWQI